MSPAQAGRPLVRGSLPATARDENTDEGPAAARLDCNGWPGLVHDTPTTTDRTKRGFAPDSGLPGRNRVGSRARRSRPGNPRWPRQPRMTAPDRTRPETSRRAGTGRRCLARR